MRIIGATGHRPKSFADPFPLVIGKMNKIAYRYLEAEKPDKIVSGMALGWDTCIANMALDLRIPFIAAVPFPEQASRWPQAQQEFYEYLLSKAEKVITVCPIYSTLAFKKRNIVIVDESTEIVALFNGSRNSGTAHCLNYAALQQKPITNLFSEYA